MRAALLLVALLLAGCAAPSAPTTTTPSSTPSSTPAPTETPSSPPATTPTPSGNADALTRFTGCKGSGPVTFAQSPMRVSDFGNMLPYGVVVGGHVTPIDHMYFSPANVSLGRDAYEVRAIGDAVIYSIQPRDVNVESGAAKLREWRVDMAHTCTFTSYFDLLTSLAPDLEAAYNASRAGNQGPLSVPVKAGQLVGRIGAQTLDFGVYDYNVTLPGFLVPSHYDREPWKVHTVDPFPHFPPDVRAAMLAKMLRTAEPRAGKIDWDVDGALVGNWFKVGTNGYAGVDPSNYWEGHLSVSPDTYDPSHVVFSIGDFNGTPRQFGVKGNPDPAKVTPASGLLKWELVTFDEYDNKTGERGFSRDGTTGIQPGDGITARNDDQVVGVALLQMTGPRALKLEVFPGKAAADVTGFDADAWSYER